MSSANKSSLPPDVSSFVKQFGINLQGLEPEAREIWNQLNALSMENPIEYERFVSEQMQLAKEESENTQSDGKSRSFRPTAAFCLEGYSFGGDGAIIRDLSSSSANKNLFINFCSSAIIEQPRDKHGRPVNLERDTADGLEIPLIVGKVRKISNEMNTVDIVFGTQVIELCARKRIFKQQIIELGLQWLQEETGLKFDHRECKEIESCTYKGGLGDAKDIPVLFHVDDEMLQPPEEKAKKPSSASKQEAKGVLDSTKSLLSHFHKEKEAAVSEPVIQDKQPPTATKKSSADKVDKSADKPSSIVKEVKKPIIEEVGKPSEKPLVKEVKRKPLIEEVGKPSETEKPLLKEVKKPIIEEVGQPSEKPLIKEVKKPIIEEVGKPSEKPLKKTLIEEIGKPSETEKPLIKEVKKPLIEEVGQPSEKPLVKEVKKPVIEEVGKPSEKRSVQIDQLPFTVGKSPNIDVEKIKEDERSTADEPKIQPLSKRDIQEFQEIFSAFDEDIRAIPDNSRVAEDQAINFLADIAKAVSMVPLKKPEDVNKTPQSPEEVLVVNPRTDIIKLNVQLQADGATGESVLSLSLQNLSPAVDVNAINLEVSHGEVRVRCPLDSFADNFGLKDTEIVSVKLKNTRLLFNPAKSKASFKRKSRMMTFTVCCDSKK